MFGGGTGRIDGLQDMLREVGREDEGMVERCCEELERLSSIVASAFHVEETRKKNGNVDSNGGDEEGHDKARDSK